MKYIKQDTEEDVVAGMGEDRAVEEDNLDVIVEDIQHTSAAQQEHIVTHMEIVLTLAVNVKHLQRNTITMQPLQTL